MNQKHDVVIHHHSTATLQTVKSYDCARCANRHANRLMRRGHNSAVISYFDVAR